ncbi:adenylate isopentenyltransferase 5, chloroplastic [Populus trichocarpa]|nr:adenylate isopentenyltransferase 5, chloroplastic [Populus trichocarpa]
MEIIPLQPKLSSYVTAMSMAASLPIRMERGMRLQFQCHWTRHRNKQIISPLSANDGSTKQKALFVMGTTATGKSKLSIDLATHFQGEIINSDKIQVYKGLDILTNKVSEDESRGVPHHLLGFVEPGEEFTTQDFCNHVHMAMRHIIGNGNIPIIAGGSNRYIEALVEDPLFKDNYDTCFLWVDVALPILFVRAAKRVDKMLDAGLVDEVRGMFIPGIDHNSGIWRAIGIPELEPYFQAEMEMADEVTRKMLLDTGIKEMKENTKKLINKQLRKIKYLANEKGWKLHRIDATFVYERSGNVDEDVWDDKVLRPSLEMLTNFLQEDGKAEEVKATVSRSKGLHLIH